MKCSRSLTSLFCYITRKDGRTGYPLVLPLQTNLQVNETTNQAKLTGRLPCKSCGVCANTANGVCFKCIKDSDLDAPKLIQPNSYVRHTGRARVRKNPELGVYTPGLIFPAYLHTAAESNISNEFVSITTRAIAAVPSPQKSTQVEFELWLKENFKVLFPIDTILDSYDVKPMDFDVWNQSGNFTRAIRKANQTAKEYLLANRLSRKEIANKAIFKAFIKREKVGKIIVDGPQTLRPRFIQGCQPVASVATGPWFRLSRITSIGLGKVICYLQQGAMQNHCLNGSMNDFPAPTPYLRTISHFMILRSLNGLTTQSCPYTTRLV